MPPDELDTVIQDIIDGYPGLVATPVARHQRPAGHPVLWFAAGTGLFLFDAILVWLLVWFLRHG